MMTRLLRHILRINALYPVLTFWLAATVVIPATWAHWLSHGHAVGILGVVAVALIWIADKRDTHAASVALEHKVDEVAALVVDRSDSQDARIDHLTDIADKDT